MASVFDINTAREKFPALRQNQVYFDNAGGSQTLGAVIESITNYLSNNNVQMGATYDVGKESLKLYNEGYAAGARYINADAEEVVIGPSTTQLFRNLSQAINFSPGDELVVSKLDHEANIVSWVAIAKRLGLTLKWWEAPPTTNPKLDPEDLKKLLSPRTRLVTCTHVSNILGTINDIKAIAQVVHTIPGAMLCVDGVAHAPHQQIDVKDLGVDFYSFSWYKVYGPHLAMLYGSRAAQKNMTSLGHFFLPTDSMEWMMGLAAANYELTQSLPKIVEYFGGSNPKAFFQETGAHEEKLQKVLLDFLNSRSDTTIYGEKSFDRKVRVPTISFAVKGWGSRELVETVEKQSSFGFRWGHFYSKRLCDEILQAGDEGVVRVSMVHYNTEEEIKEFVKVLEGVLASR